MLRPRPTCTRTPGAPRSLPPQSPPPQLNPCSLVCVLARYLSEYHDTRGCRRLATSSVHHLQNPRKTLASVSKIRRQLGKPGARISTRITHHRTPPHLACGAANPLTSFVFILYPSAGRGAAASSTPPKSAFRHLCNAPPCSAAPTRYITAPHLPYHSENGPHSKRWPWRLTAGHT